MKNFSLLFLPMITLAVVLMFVLVSHTRESATSQAAEPRLAFGRMTPAEVAELLN